MIPGEYKLAEGKIVVNEGLEAISVEVTNKGDRPIQVGSHHHFAEVNPGLDFDRDAAYGKRLDIPSGTAVRFEPGDKKEVQLVDIKGSRKVYGLNDMVNGCLDHKKK